MRHHLKRLAVAALIAALYCAITWAVAPIAYGPIQFRLGELLKPLALKGRQYIAGLTVGLFLANLLSPWSGPGELIFMPLACWAGGEIALILRRRPIVAILAYAFWVSVAVAAMLRLVAGVPFAATLGSIAFSESILMFVGWQASERVFRRAAQGRTAPPA